MAIRQYVGARYVPRFTGLYDATQIYNALDVVDNGSGTSYIAKKTVPAGTPLTDTEYWFVYGATSGAILNLQQQIDDMKDGDIPGSLQNQIDNLNNRVFMLFGDSYALGIDGDDNQHIVPGGGWATRFKNLMEGYGVKVYYDPGASNGIATPTPILPDYEAQIAAMTDEEKAAVTDVVYIGGWNDQWITEASVRSAMEVFCSRVRNVMPSARILIAPYTIAPVVSNENIVPRYRICQKYGAEFNIKLINLLAQKSLSGADNIHPTVGAYSLAQTYITAVILSGECHYSFELTSRTYTDSDGETITFNCYANENEIRFMPVSTQRGDFVLNITTASGTKNFVCSNDDYIKLPLTYFLKHSCNWFENGSKCHFHIRHSIGYSGSPACKSVTFL